MQSLPKSRPPTRPVIPEVESRRRMGPKDAPSLDPIFATVHRRDPFIVSPDIDHQDVLNSSPDEIREAEYQRILADKKHPFWDGPNVNTSLSPSSYDLRDEYEQILVETPEPRRDLVSTFALAMLSIAGYTEGYSNYQASSTQFPSNGPRSTFKEPYVSTYSNSPGHPQPLEPRGSRQSQFEEGLKRMRSQQCLPRHRNDWNRRENMFYEIDREVEQELLEPESPVPSKSPIKPPEVADPDHRPPPVTVTPSAPIPSVNPSEHLEANKYQDPRASGGSHDRVDGARTHAQSNLTAAAPVFIPRKATTNTSSSWSSEVSMSDTSNAASRSSRMRRRRRSRGTQTTTSMVGAQPGGGVYYERPYHHQHENPNLQRTRASIQYGYESNGSPSPSRGRAVRVWHFSP